jgi:hypothetical protein
LHWLVAGVLAVGVLESGPVVNDGFKFNKGTSQKTENKAR